MTDAPNAQGNGDQGAADAAVGAANDDAANNGAGAQGAGDGQGDGAQGGQQSSAPAKGTGLDNLDVEAILAEGEGANGDGDGDGSGAGGQGDGQGDGQGSGSGDGAGDGQGDGQGAGQGDGDQGAGAGDGDGAGGDGDGQGSGDGQGDGAQGDDDTPTDWKSIDGFTVDQLAVKPDEKYGIKPLTDLPEPAQDQDYNEYFKKEMLPRMVQAVANVVGLRQKSFDASSAKENEAKTKAETERADAWVADIDALVKDNSIPAYAVDKDGKLDTNSEGGKVVAAVFEYMNKINKDAKDGEKVYSFKVAHRLWKADQAEQQQHQDDNKERQNNKERARRMGGGNGSYQSDKATAAPGLRKGMTLDDIDIE